MILPADSGFSFGFSHPIFDFDRKLLKACELHGRGPICACKVEKQVATAIIREKFIERRRERVLEIRD